MEECQQGSASLQGLEIGIRAMAAAGALVVGNGGNGPHDRLHLGGTSEQNRLKLEKFLHQLKETGMHTCRTAARQLQGIEALCCTLSSFHLPLSAHLVSCLPKR